MSFLFISCGNEFLTALGHREGWLAGKEAVLHEKLIRGNEHDGLPLGAVVPETVFFAGRDLEVNGFRAEGLPFRVGGIPTFLPAVFLTKEDD